MLKDAIIAATKRPSTFREIEEKVGRQEDYALGIMLGEMVLNGELAYKDQDRTRWPVYSLRPIPRGFRCPKMRGRDDDA